VRKLTDSDKQEILKLYRESAETTSTLADRYGVSNSTISRLLKSTLQEDEYEYLVSLKRAARTPEGRAQVSYDKPVVIDEPEVQVEAEPEQEPEIVVPVKKTIKVTSPVSEPKKELPVPKRKIIKDVPAQQPLFEVESGFDDEDDSDSGPRRVRRRSSAPEKPILVNGEQLEFLEQPLSMSSIESPLLEDIRTETTALAEMLGEELLDESDEDLDDLDDDYEDEDYEDDDFDDHRPLVSKPRSGESLVRVLPLSAANLPRTCYLVIDRSSELITRPLKDFGDLGQIPSLETQQRTLPVFDNHRVAKRFSTKRDRVIKVPDSRMLHKARTHLQSKGITRLLIDGQIYSLSGV
jgi:transposase-like protein